MDALGTLIHIVAMIRINRVRLIRMNSVLNMGEFQTHNLLFYSKKKRDSKICPSANANLKMIAVRFPKHKIIKNLLKKLNFPLAIPSANISTKISPISALDVIDEFGKNINFVLDGGRSKIGLESTVINLCGNIKIMRPGAISKKEIGQTLGKNVSISKKTNKLNSPGLLKRHYSPGIPIRLNCKKADSKAAFIVFGKKIEKKNVFLSKKWKMFAIL